MPSDTITVTIPREFAELKASGLPISRHVPLGLEDQKSAIKLPRWLWAATLFAGCWGAFTPNPLLTPLAILILVICVKMLWRYGEPPILVFACAMQWLQAAAVIFYTNFYGVSLQQSFGGPELERATLLSLIAIVVLSLGIRLALIRSGPSVFNGLRSESLKINIGKAFTMYLLSFVIASIAGIVAWQFKGLSQQIYALVTVKWAAVFILAYCGFEQRSHLFVAVALLLELVTGVTGYFAGFKNVFFVLIVAALASPFGLRGKRLAIALSAAVCLFFLGVVWTAIKQDYRTYLNQGSDQQIVAVSTEESVGKLGDLLADFTWDNFITGLDGMIVRVSYVNYFALTLMNVPDHVPYERGALWFGALKHTVTPRLFFPQKAETNDSERMMLYTGVQTASSEQGTSMGIGYVAESYVDFGSQFMFVPIFLLGIFYGLIYRVFVIQSEHALLGSAIAASILIFGAYTIETSNIKIVGGNATVLIVLTVFFKLFGRPIWSFLTASPAPEIRRNLN
jgi:hypothetical protein